MLETSATDAPIALGGEVEIRAAASKADAVPVTIDAYSGGVLELADKGPTIVDLAGLGTPGTVPLLIDHRNEIASQAGSGTPRTDGKRLYVTGEIASGSAAGAQVLAGHRGGAKYQASIGATPLETERLQAGETVQVNGQSFTAGARGLLVVRRSRLNEVSVLPLGNDKTTSVAIAASHPRNGAPTMAAATSPEENPSDIRASLQAEMSQRWKQLGDILGSDPILATAVAENWTDERAELHALKASMPRSPLAHSRGAGAAPRDADVIEAAFMVNAGSDGEDLKAHFDDRTIDAAMGGDMRGFGLQDLCRLTIRRSGKSLGVGGFNPSTIRAAFEADRDIKASGNSAYSLTGITNNAANKFSLQGFNQAGTEWKQWCAVASVKDFKEHSFYRLSAGTQYKELGVGEAIPMGDLSEEKFSNMAKTHALMLTIPREVIINDDLGMVREGARLKLGYGAGLTLSHTIYGKLLDSAAVGSGKFFHTSHADRGPNYKAGADTSLSVDATEAAVTMMLKQVDKEGDPIDVVPRFLLTGPEQAFLADRICKDEYAPNYGATEREPTRNALAGRLEPLMSRYLNHASVSGGSATTWFVLADPRSLGTGAMQVVFLQGRQTPILESADTDFTTLGIQMRGYFDFDAKLMEKACAVKFAGA